MLLNESIVFVVYVGIFAAVLALIFVWLEGLLYLVQDIIAAHTHRDKRRHLIVTTWGRWDFVYSSESLPGKWVANLLEE